MTVPLDISDSEMVSSTRISEAFISVVTSVLVTTTVSSVVVADDDADDDVADSSDVVADSFSTFGTTSGVTVSTVSASSLPPAVVALALALGSSFFDDVGLSASLSIGTPFFNALPPSCA